jgi:hypothetical protein
MLAAVAGLTLSRTSFGRYSTGKSVCRIPNAAVLSASILDIHEDLMTRKLPCAKNLAVTSAVLLAAAAVIVASFATAEAETVAAKQKTRAYDATYTSRGPNVSYQSGPRTRVYITKRSWLDAGVEVLPGDRKFSDYAFPPGQSFASQNNTRSLDRQPLNSHWDLGGYPERIPLPPY